jgi:carotenoid cleavage dioxygenase-like enzyme
MTTPPASLTMTTGAIPQSAKSRTDKGFRAPFAADIGNHYLIGPYGPVVDEITAFDLPVTGEIPPGLVGRFVRNGPNPIEVSDPANHHWFLGEGMVHGVYLRAGKAEWYRNRFVRSRLVCDRLGEPYPAGTPRTRVDVVNTHVQSFAGKTLALVESGPPPMALSHELDTLTYEDFQGTLTGAFAAHPHLDPLTGEWHAITYDSGVKDEVRHVVVGTDGKVRRSVAIPVSDGPMVHDFAFTQRYVLIFDLPVVWNDTAAESGHLFPYQWSEGRAARVGLLPREGVATDIVWIDVPPCYVFHMANAFDAADGTVVVDLVEFSSMFKTSLQGPGEGPPVLSRWALDPVARTISKIVLSGRPREFPRIDERLTGRRHRYIYGAGIQTDRGSALCFDTEAGVEVAHDFGPGRFGSECVFVPKSIGAGEGDGWVMTYVWNAPTNTSDLVIIDSTRFDGPPQAVVHLPVRVPFGFHGSWIADER